MEYKKSLAKAKLTILQQQKKSWSKFCESISFKNTPRKIWNFFKKLSGKATTMEYPIMDNKLPLTYINHKLENFWKEYMKIVNKKTKRFLPNSEKFILFNLQNANE